MVNPPDRNPQPDRAAAKQWWAAGSKLIADGKWSDAAKALRTAVQFDSEDAALWSDLGVAEQYTGDLDAAAMAYEKSLSLDPQQQSALVNLAFVLVQRGNLKPALELLRPLLESTEAFPPAWIVAGHAYRAQGDSLHALEAFRQAVAFDPTDLVSQHNLGNALLTVGDLTAAKQVAHELILAQPSYAGAWQLLASIEQAQGRIEQAVTAYRRSVELCPDAGNHSNYLLGIQYLSDITPELLLPAHREWDNRYARHLFPQSPPSPAMETRSPRIGFVSPQFGLHPIGFLALPLVEALKNMDCVTICYSARKVLDSYTDRFQNATNAWRVTSHLSAEQLASQIRADKIDILIDLMGHTSPSLLAFAYHPAALQISWLGYVGTTGMRAMDGLLADAYHIRPGEEANYSEQVLRMPCGYACYGPPGYAPDVGALPALQSGNVTFGCFNNPSKFSPGIVQAWAEILQRVPHSRLLLKYLRLNDSETQQLIRNQFAAAGVDPLRVLIEGEADHETMLATYQRVDLALDTQPYSGGLTTCEPLWMGVPVITYPGKTFAGRHSTSHLMNAGLGQFIAPNRASYIDLAISWANRLDELSTIRSTIREQIRQSPLCDAHRFAEDFLTVLRAAWYERIQRSES